MIHTDASGSRGKQRSRWALLSVTTLVAMMTGTGVGAPASAQAQLEAAATALATPQTIDFPQPDPVAMGATRSLTATASSGLDVTYTSLTTGTCTVSGSVVTPVHVGTCTIEATQPGNAEWDPADPVQRDITVTKGDQTVDFPKPSDVLVNAGPVTLTATATPSNLAVTFASTTIDVCTESGTNGEVVNLLTAGTCTIRADQAGDADWNPATVFQSFQVSKVPQTISFSKPPNVPVGAGSVTLDATATSGLTVSYTSGTPSICTVSGDSVTLGAPGTCTITATQAGDDTFAAAPAVTHSFTVTGDTVQTITFPDPADVPFSADPVTLTATADSGLPVSYTSNTPAVCTVSADHVTLVTVGTCTIEANQSGDATYRAADPVTQSFTITPGPQSITFPQPADAVMTDESAELTATASSGLPVSYSSSTPAVCSVAGSTVTLVAAGECTINATQNGDDNYQPATPITRSFQVTKAPQTIDFPQPSPVSLAAGSVTLTASASSGLAVAFDSSTPAVCTVSSATVTLVAAGECTINASQSGNGTYAEAQPVTRTFTVAPAPAPGTPDVPTGVTATAGVSSITVTWHAPVPTGVTVTGYTAMADPGDATCSTTGATSCVLGAEAGVTYTITVIAHAAGGDSLPSAPSNAVTPTAPQPPAQVPATDLTLTTDQGDISSATPGQDIVIRGTGFAPFSTVTVTIYSTPTPLGSVVTDAQGNFSLRITVPGELAPGAHTVIAQGVDPDGTPRVMKLALSVGLRNVSDTSDELPRTGSALMGMFLIGIAATLTGAGMFTLGFRRTRPVDRTPQAG